MTTDHDEDRLQQEALARKASVEATIEKIADLTDGQLYDLIRMHLARKDADRDQVVTQALRHPDLVERSAQQTLSLLRNVTAQVERLVGTDPDTVEKRHRTRYFQNQVGMERQTLEEIRSEVRRQRGDTRPNLRQQARMELQRRHPEEYLDILRGLEERSKAEARERRARVKAVRREERDRQRAVGDPA